ncbi:MAG: GNAT family N-acetyltransferase [Spirochaetes bacterium]|nr:GNAT family N-acetyltransferase [Spirochaetota bacterium]
MNLEIKQVQNEEELNQCLHVRYKVFIEELQFDSKEKYPDKMEQDKYDELDTTIHFIAMINGRGVGTARLIGYNNMLLEENKIFGLSMEDLYDLSEYRENGLVPYEISRSSVIRGERSSIIILDLWKICINYCLMHNTPAFCSCAGTETDNHEDAQLIYELLKLKGLMHSFIHTNPLSESGTKHFSHSILFNKHHKKDLLIKRDSEQLTLNDFESRGIKLPPTLDYFSRIGAKFTGPPVIFPEFKMYTIPMILEFNHIHEPFKTFFKRESSRIKFSNVEKKLEPVT